MAADFELAVRGIVIGLSVAAPVGSMSLLCIRRIWIGLRAMRATFGPLNADPAGAHLASPAAATLATLGLTMTNPLTILSFAAIFAGFGAATTNDVTSAIVLIAAVFAGSMLWWFCLASSVAFFSARLNDSALLWINRLAGMVIVAFGIGAVATAHY